MSSDSHMQAGAVGTRGSRRPGILSTLRRYRLAAVVAAVLVLAALAWVLLPVKDWLSSLAGWIDSFGPSSAAIYVIIYVVAAVFMAPGALLSALAGLAFGLWGLAVAVVGATLGAGAAFLVSRHLARDYVGERVRRHRHFDAVDRAIGAEGWKVVALLRLSPLVPYNFVNYLLGATRIGFGPYMAATSLGVIPCTLLFVWVGAAGHTALAGMGENGAAMNWLIVGAGLAASVAVSVLVTRAARRRLERAGLKG